MRRMADAAGHFITVALDQRPPIAQLLAARLGITPSQVRFADMMAAKRLVVEVLAPMRARCCSIQTLRCLQPLTACRRAQV
jgi:tagatose-1,6-bisphosphate aldolase